MDVSEKWGTDVDAAIELALGELKLTIDEVDVTVLEEPSRGFFGLGSKLALVRVERKKEKYEDSPKREDKRKNHAKKPLSDLMAEEPESLITETVKEEEEKLPKEIIVEKEVGELFPVEDHVALEFLREVSEQMGLEINITAKANEENIYVDIQGKDSGTIIGKRGQTLDAIQYLTSLVVNKGKDDYVRVVVDAENYRSKREKTLEGLAQRLAGKVVKTRRSVRLEPMNPYERKVIHATLQGNPGVTTRSEGEDPYRRVIIELK